MASKCTAGGKKKCSKRVLGPRFSFNLKHLSFPNEGDFHGVSNPFGWHPTSPGGQKANDHGNTTIPKDIHPLKLAAGTQKFMVFVDIYSVSKGAFFSFQGCKTFPCPPKISPLPIGIPELSSPQHWLRSLPGQSCSSSWQLEFNIDTKLTKQTYPKTAILVRKKYLFQAIMFNISIFNFKDLYRFSNHSHFDPYNSNLGERPSTQ